MPDTKTETPTLVQEAATLQAKLLRAERDNQVLHNAFALQEKQFNSMRDSRDQWKESAEIRWKALLDEQERKESALAQLLTASQRIERLEGALTQIKDISNHVAQCRKIAQAALADEKEGVKP